jgi:hypothetical protein
MASKGHVGVPVGTGAVLFDFAAFCGRRRRRNTPSASSILDDYGWSSHNVGASLWILDGEDGRFSVLFQHVPQRYDFKRWENGTSIRTSQGLAQCASWERAVLGVSVHILVSLA